MLDGLRPPSHPEGKLLLYSLLIHYHRQTVYVACMSYHCMCRRPYLIHSMSNKC